MGADWYYPFVLYGYTINCPIDMDYMRFVNKLYRNYVASDKSNIVIKSILPEFHSRMEFGENSELDENAYLVIGFKPCGDLNKMHELAEELATFIRTSPNISSLELSEKPSFHTGIEWIRDIEDDDETYCTESDEESEEEEDCDEESDSESEDETESVSSDKDNSE